MNISEYLHQRRRGGAFSLIELIIVIAIIAVLAGLLFPIVGKIGERKQISRAQTELSEVKSAIDEYKTKLGYYPPDNPTNVFINPLYFELMGTTNNQNGTTPPTQWGTLDGSAEVDSTGTPNITSYFGVQGLANSSTNLHTGDTGTAAASFLNNLLPTQVGSLDPANKPLVKILVCSVPWPSPPTAAIVAQNPSLNPWCYNSSHPTNNVGTYDLWVDLIIRGKTNRISNWSPDPIKL